MMVWLGDPGPIHRFTSLILTEFYQYGQLYSCMSDRKGILGSCHWTREKNKLTETLLGELWPNQNWQYVHDSNSLMKTVVCYKRKQNTLIPVSAFHSGVIWETQEIVSLFRLWGCGDFSSLKSSLLWRWTGQNLSENKRSLDSLQLGIPKETTWVIAAMFLF